MPKYTIRTVLGPLTRTSAIAPATREVYVYRETTPEASHAPIRSTWRDNPPLKPLTNARIREYALRGRYGEAKQQAEQARLTAEQARKRRAKQEAKFERLMLEKYA